MKRPKQYQRGELSAEGATATEAKRLVEQQVDRVVNGSYDPKLLTVHTQQAFLYRNLYGWQYATVDGEGRMFTGNQVNEPTRAAVETHARYHLAQRAWTPEVTDDVAWMAGCGLDQVQVADLGRWTRWQRAYRSYADAGHDDPTCRRLVQEDEARGKL